MTSQERPPGFGWLVPTAAVGFLPSTLSRVGMGSVAWGQLISIVVGLLAGAFWYWFYPRPLAERLFPAVAVLLGLYGVLLVSAAVLSGGEPGATFDGSDVPQLIGWAGVLAVLVLSERWGERRRLASGRTRRPPRKRLGARVGPG